LHCCNKKPQTGWLINSRDVFLSVLEAGSTDQGTGRFTVERAISQFTAVSSRGRSKVALRALFYQGNNFILESLRTSHLLIPSLGGEDFNI
jgi:hypothetical protein